MHDEIQIAPSILSADFANLERDVAMVSAAGADWIHVDVMDGHFVPNLSIGPAHVKALKRITDVPLDVHLMIDNPETQLPWYIDAGADSITVHVEACDDAADVLARIRNAGVKAAISLNPETDAESIADLVGLVDMILVMSVHPGFGGQSFIESSLEKIAAIRSMCDEAGVSPLIEVDGGISSANAASVVDAGANVLVAGSAVFCADDPAEEVRSLKRARA